MTRVYTVGHSTRSFEELVSILRGAGITLLADVRARPQSRFYPHFNRKFLEANLPMKYICMGDRLGGKNAHSITPDMFDAGIRDLAAFAEHDTVCIMCSEGSPTPTTWRPEGCHRWNTITPALERQGVEVVHL